MKNRSRTEYSLFNMLTGLVGYGINTILGFLCRIIFVRTLSTDYLGVSGLFTNILSMLSLAELGISSAIIYALYKPIVSCDEKKIASIMQYYRKAYMAIGTTIAAIGLATLPFLNIIIREPPAIKESLYLLYLLFLTNTVVSYFFSYRASLLTAMQRHYIVAGYSYIVTIIQSVLQMIFLLLTHNYLVYLLIQLAGGIGYNIWVSHKASMDYPYITDKNAAPLPKAEKKALLKNVKALAINKLSGVLVNSTDNIAITFFSGITTVGYASNYTLLSSTLGGVLGQVFNALPGSVGNLNASSNDEEKYHFFNVLNLTNFWLFGWAAIGILFVSSDLVAFLFGTSYVLPFKIPLIIAINSYTIGMLQAPYTYKSTLGLFRYGQYLLFFTGFINLAMDIILGRIWGMFGIYLATLFARICTNLWYEPYAVFRHGLKRSPLIYFKRYLKFFLVLVVTCVICAIFCSFCRFSLPVNLILKIVICTIIPNGIFFLIFGNTEEFQYIRTRLANIFRKLTAKH